MDLETAVLEQAVESQADEAFDGFPLSLQQERLWELCGEGATPFRVHAALRLEGTLDEDRLRRALSAVVADHEALRTVFRRLPGMEAPFQVITEGASPGWEAINLRGVDPGERRVRLDQLFEEGVRGAFEWEDEPPLSLRLATLSDDLRVLLIGLPALTFDVFSLDVLIEALAAAYAGEGSGDEPEPMEPIQYVDFSEWQNEMLESPEEEAGRSFWRAQRVFPLVPVRLPLERWSEAEGPGAFDPATLSWELEGETSDRLAAVAGELGVSEDAVLLAAWSGLIRRLSGESRVVVGRLADGRAVEDLRTAMGPLFKALPIKVATEESWSFGELAAEVDRLLVAAGDHQELFSSAHLLEAADDPVLESLLPYGFELRRWPEPVDADGVRFSLLREQACHEPFGLKLTITRPGNGSCGGARASLRFDGSRYGTVEAEVIRAQLVSLLDGALAEPSRPLLSIPLLDESQRRMLTVWNDTVAELPEETIVDRFRARVAADPGADAVVFRGTRLTFAELEARANRIAWALRTRGIGPEDRVAFCLNRSAELIVMVTGILKAGAAYVPLDPWQPAERLALVVEEASPALVVVEREFFDNVSLEGVATVERAEMEAEAREQPADDPRIEIAPESLAYVIYTSGSTGKPKGVMVSHGAVANLYRALGAALADHLPAATRASVNAPLAFDASVKQLLQILDGHAVCVLPEEVRRDGNELLAYLREHGIRMLDCTPAQLQLMMATGLDGIEETLDLVLVGGEPIDGPLWDTLAERAGTVFFNVYGPTECTVDAAVRRIEAGVDRPRIGRALPNVELHVLDRHLRRQPIGVAGHLHISGRGVGRGYLRRPGTTAEMFVPDPFSGRPGARMYRTGDRARYLADGDLEILGRVDRQVKLRGYRIELGEIEEVLASHPGIRQSAVVLRGTGAAQPRIVAYVAPEGEAIDEATVREHARERLPEYMLPAQIVVLESLPLTPNGKLDFDALPEPSDERPSLGAGYAEPRDDVERQLAEIWGRLLAVERVGIRDNFFELGGDSILSIQAVARAGEAGIRLTPRQMFENQTIAELALVAGESRRTDAEQGAVEGDVPLTPIQRRLLERGLLDVNHWNQAVMLAGDGEVDVEALETVLRALIEQHDALRHRFEPREAGEAGEAGPPWSQRALASVEGCLHFTWDDLSDLPADEREAEIARRGEAAQRSLDLREGPLFRVAGMGFGDEWRLLLVIHHLVVDGVSWRVLLYDLQKGYEQRLSGRDLDLGSKSSSFRAWAERLERHADEEAVRRELPYWLDSLDGARRDGMALPRERDGENLESSARQAEIILEAERTRQLLQEVPAAYNTQVQEVLLTALVRAVAEWRERAGGAVLVELEGHGREDLFDDLDLSRTVGWFTSMYPVALPVRLDEPEGEALKRVKETVRRVPGGGVGYGVLRYLGDEETSSALAGLPEAEIGFNYLGRLDDVLDGDGPFRPAREHAGAFRSPRGERLHVLDFSADISEERLRLRCIHSENVHSPERVDGLLELARRHLMELIDHCLDPEAGAYTPSDFPMAELDDDQLGAILAGVEFEGETES